MIDNSKIIQLFILDYTNFRYNVNSTVGLLYESGGLVYESIHFEKSPCFLPVGG